MYGLIVDWWEDHSSHWTRIVIGLLTGHCSFSIIGKMDDTFCNRFGEIEISSHVLKEFELIEFGFELIS